MVLKNPLIDEIDIGFDLLLDLLVALNPIVNIDQIISLQLHLAVLIGQIEDSHILPVGVSLNDDGLVYDKGLGKFRMRMTAHDDVDSRNFLCQWFILRAGLLLPESAVGEADDHIKLFLLS